MATTKESMKIIAGGLGRRKEPEIIMGGKVITIAVPDGLTEVLDELIEEMLGKCEDAGMNSEECGLENGGNPKNNEPKRSETEEFASRIVSVLAARAANNLMKIAEGVPKESMLIIVRCIGEMGAEGLISMLKAIFLSHGMEAEAEELDILDICMEYDEFADYVFEDEFYDTDAMDWYSVESLIREKARTQNSKPYNANAAVCDEDPSVAVFFSQERVDDHHCSELGNTADGHEDSVLTIVPDGI